MNLVGTPPTYQTPRVSITADDDDAVAAAAAASECSGKSGGPVLMLLMLFLLLTNKRCALFENRQSLLSALGPTRFARHCSCVPIRQMDSQWRRRKQQQKRRATHRH